MKKSKFLIPTQPGTQRGKVAFLSVLVRRNQNNSLPIRFYLSREPKIYLPKSGIPNEIIRALVPHQRGPLLDPHENIRYAIVGQDNLEWCRKNGSPIGESWGRI